LSYGLGGFIEVALGFDEALGYGKCLDQDSIEQCHYSATTYGALVGVIRHRACCGEVFSNKEDEVCTSRVRHLY